MKKVLRVLFLVLMGIIFFILAVLLDSGLILAIQTEEGLGIFGMFTGFFIGWETAKLYGKLFLDK